MGGDISRFIERGEQSRQLTVGAQRAMKKKGRKPGGGGGTKGKRWNGHRYTRQETSNRSSVGL